MAWQGDGTFRRTDGTRTGTQVWQDARDAGVNIRADDHDTHDEDLADGLENTVALDGQNTTTSDNAILRYDTGQSAFTGASIGASEIVGRSATGDVRGLSAATARQVMNLASAMADLTTGEVSQLKNIDSVAITNTQWGYLGGLDQNLRTTDGVTFATVDTGQGANELHPMNQAVRTSDSPNFGGATISSTQWGYLGGLGSAPLEDDDLAANGGTLPQNNVDEVIPGAWVFQGKGGVLSLRNESDTGTTRLQFHNNSESDYKQLRVNHDNNDRFEFWDGGTRVLNWDDQRIVFEVGVLGTGTVGGDQGPGTANFAALYDKGNRVYSDSSTGMQVVELGGDFDAGEEVRCERIGNWVTITGVGSQLTHSSSGDPSSSSGAIPSAYRPTNSVRNVYNFEGADFYVVEISDSGVLSLHYRNTDGSVASKSGSDNSPIISYLIT